MTVLPGLVDAHNHLAITYKEEPESNIYYFTYVADSTPLRAIQAVSDGMQMLSSGFTVVRDMGNNGNYADSALRVAIEQGWVPGPTIVNSGIIIDSLPLLRITARSSIVSMKAHSRATIEDLHGVPGKAELVKGELVLMSPTGGDPGYAGDEIYASLREYGRRTKLGRAIGDNKAFRVNLPGRESFSPDAAFYIGPRPGMKFYQGAPLFAVEVRSENDYGPGAEDELAAKRADYFAAGTKVVRDVDLLSEDVVRAYSADEPDRPRVFRRHETADGEPALPGWRMPVDDLFEE